MHEIIGGYDVKLNFTMDANFLFRAFKKAKNIEYVDEIWGNYMFIKNTKSYNNSIGKGWNEEERKYYFKLVSKYRKKVPIIKRILAALI